MLRLHVLDLDLDERAGARADGEGGAGILHVDMDVRRGRVANHEQRLPAGRCECALDRAEVEGGGLATQQDELGAVAGALVLDGVRLDRLACREPWRGRQRDSGEAQREAFEEDGDPGASGIDDARLAEAGQQLGRPLHACIRLVDERRQQRLVVRTRCEAFPRHGGRLAQDGEHRAFHGMAHGGIGRVRGLRQRLNEGRAGGLVAAIEGFGEAADHLAQDHAAVPARTEERRARHLPGEVADAGNLRRDASEGGT